MKSFTDIPQSEKLAEILPIKSADMFYWRGVVLRRGNYKAMNTEFDIPCWSLAALLDLLPICCDDGHHCLTLINANPYGEIEWICCYEDSNGDWLHEFYASNPIDACYEMIFKLKENGLL